MTQAEQTFQALRIFFTGVGGQGTLLATRLVGEAALEEGLPVAMSEIHGMAQRGGVVESSVVVGNVCSPTIADGEADIVLAFEPLEAARALPKCHSKTLVISSTVPVVPFTVATGQAEYPAIEDLLGAVRSRVASVIEVDTAALARDAGSERAANLVMLGVLAGTGRLPVSMKSWQEALRRILPERVQEVNRRAFQTGYTLGREL
ncbi:MAG: indolepyruvate oxidoreductase subunit beta [Syntrophobacteraceae bacterium]|nr:indolepyruvate oxidoreductase subunit beta [Syntrophobacteraceae bacterium]